MVNSLIKENSNSCISTSLIHTGNYWDVPLSEFAPNFYVPLRQRKSYKHTESWEDHLPAGITVTHLQISEFIALGITWMDFSTNLMIERMLFSLEIFQVFCLNHRSAILNIITDNFRLVFHCNNDIYFRHESWFIKIHTFILYCCGFKEFGTGNWLPYFTTLKYFLT